MLKCPYSQTVVHVNFMRLAKLLVMEEILYNTAFLTKVLMHYYPAPGIGGRGIVFGRLRRFLSLFLCQQYYEKTAGPICMKFSGKVWSDHGTT